MSQDSYKGSAYAPWTQHLYTYTGNNPVNFIDPTGHKGEWLAVFGVVAAAVAITAIVVVSGGAAVPLVAAAATAFGTSYATAAAVTVVAAGTVALTGTTQAVMGGFDVVETYTGKNSLKENVFKGNEELYYGVEDALAAYNALGTTALAPRKSSFTYPRSITYCR